ncbi:alpha/beta hydrolase [Lichenicola cladoniae]|uniref:Palmitoyl-protein thioesterase ABHD10, mitochondrial n=1 Tax=Lichenicola cladoniae TaxID=1484109 RepID=A0A6M8HNU9_9PROT|nr:alpha/beta hydrolase [Lichenicola cladoniae]NPD67520.1 alpha/beta hydrolase [Acetobacteraceae bacterium]QKE89957.1 alpha/beta hydrolase [Lichenicola cladoniae]
MSNETLHQITRPDGIRLAARHLPGRAPTIVFLPGLRSDMTGDKARALVAFAEARGQAMLRLDYSGHGESGGRFDEGSVAVWRDDAIAIIDALAPGPVVLVGSSMGGWIALMVAIGLAGEARVRGLVGIAAAPDFTREMVARLPPIALEALARDGRVVLPAEPDPLVLTSRAVADGEACSLMDGPIAVACPVRLLHGQRDDVVSWKTALEIAKLVTSEDCVVTLVKDGDHRLSRVQDIGLLQAVLQSLLNGQTASS